MAEQKNLTSDEKLWGALAYLWILSIVVLLVKKDSKFVAFHAKQGLILFVGELFWIIPVIGWLIGLICGILAIVGLIKALQGKEWPIPVVSELAKKINL